MRTGRRLALASIFASAALSLFNIILGWRGGSTSTLAAGLEFAGDVFASTLVLVGIWLAGRPPDANHPYGHGRFETLAGLLVGIILAAGGGGICFGSVSQIGGVHPPPEAYTVWPLMVAAAAKGILAGAKFRLGNRIRSSALTADAWNDAVDVVSALTALGALGLTLMDPLRFLDLDHYGGVAVGVFVIYSGLHVVRETSMQLVDTMPGAPLMDEIRRVALAVPQVMGVEKCFARKTGLQYHVDLHLEVDPAISVRASHDIATEVRIAIKEQIESVADVLVHVEPHGGA